MKQSKRKMLPTKSAWARVTRRVGHDRSCRLAEGAPEIVLVPSSHRPPASERKRSQAARITSQALFEQAPDAIILSDPEGRIVDANPKACALLGYTREAIRALGLQELQARSSIDDGGMPWDRSAVEPCETVLARSDGVQVPVEITRSRLVDQGTGIIFSIVRDTSERKLAGEALARRARELAALYETSLEINSQPDLATLLPAIVRRATDLVAARTGGLYLLAPDADELDLVVSYNLPSHLLGVRLRKGQGVAGQVAETGRPLVVEDYEAWQGRATVYEGMVFGRVLAVPMRVGDRIIGVIDITNHQRKDGFSEEDVRLVSLFADQAAIAVENARLLRESQRREVELAGLYDVTLATSGAMETQDLLDRVALEVKKLIEMDGFFIALYDPIRNDYEVVVATEEGHSIADMKGRRIALSEPSLMGRLCETRQSLLIEDLSDDPAASSHLMRGGKCQASWLGAPMVVQDKMLGALAALSFHTHAFGETDRRLLEALAAQVAVGIERARLYEAERRRNAELEAIRQASLHVTSSLEAEAVLRAILQHTMELIEADDAHVFLYDGERLTHGAALFAAGLPVRAIEPRPNGVTYTVARTGRRMVIPDVNRDPLFDDWPWGGAIACLPLRMGERVRGVMNVAYAKPHFFDADELRALELLADQAAVAIENARLYAEARRHAQELEKRVAERTAELRAANESLREAARPLAEAAQRLEELNRLKSQFVANVSHELRTPLSNIKLYLSLLERGKPDKQAQYMVTLHREANLLHHLIEQLLDLSRLDLGKEPMALEVVDLNRLAGALVADRTALAASRGLTLTLETEPGLPCTQADTRMVTQVLTNLLTNAMNYTPAGGLITVQTCTRSTAPAALAGPVTKTTQRWVMLAVCDTGPGIAAEDLAHLFERFYRGAAARQSNVPGTGLGLAISQEIAQRQGGIITVDSQIGVGSTFRVWFPALPMPV